MIDQNFLDQYNASLKWARAVMNGEIKVSPEQRELAKIITYAERYSAGPNAVDRALKK